VNRIRRGKISRRRSDDQSSGERARSILLIALIGGVSGCRQGPRKRVLRPVWPAGMVERNRLQNRFGAAQAFGADHKPDRPVARKKGYRSRGRPCALARPPGPIGLRRTPGVFPQVRAPPLTSRPFLRNSRPRRRRSGRSLHLLPSTGSSTRGPVVGGIGQDGTLGWRLQDICWPEFADGIWVAGAWGPLSDPDLVLYGRHRSDW